jgi:hypothetical protein
MVVICAGCCKCADNYLDHGKFPDVEGSDDEPGEESSDRVMAIRNEE